MARLHRQPSAATALLVPLLILATPSWFGVAGVGPWAVLWLLPWALVDGPVSGGFAGCPWVWCSMDSALVE